MDLRSHVFVLAEEHVAFDGTVAYTTPITDQSDLTIDLFFETRESARKMETALIRAVRDRWHTGTAPLIKIADAAQHLLQRRVLANDYDKAVSPERDAFNFAPDDAVSHATTVLDEVEIARESVVRLDATVVKFEKSHIVATLKRTRFDDDSNWIPLPADWHDLFDGYAARPRARVLPDRPRAYISIVGVTPDLPIAREADGRSPVDVHVYFHPAFPNAAYMVRMLRDATRVREGVYVVRVFKRDPATFCVRLLTRHNAVTATWRAVP